MAAPTNIYVDPAIAANSGSGAIGDPYGDLQYALNTVTRDSTNGDQFNIKAGAAEILSAVLSLTTYGTPTSTAPLIFRGYTSAANDGGIGDIDGNNGNFQILAATASVTFIDLKLHNTGSADIIGLSSDGCVQQCELYDSTGDGIQFGASRCTVIGNHFHDISNYGVNMNAAASCLVKWNYFKNGSSKKFLSAIRAPGSTSTIEANIISVDGSSDGIEAVSNTALASVIQNNSILSSSGTGVGIELNDTDRRATAIANNLVEGFSGTGGVGVKFSGGSQNAAFYGGHGVYNCATAYDTNTDEVMLNAGDNETLGATPFGKSGSDTFANRFTYFAPADTGNVHGGAYPSGSNRDKGAVQHADAGGGGSGIIYRRPLVVGA